MRFFEYVYNMFMFILFKIHSLQKKASNKTNILESCTSKKKNYNSLLLNRMCVENLIIYLYYCM